MTLARRALAALAALLGATSLHAAVVTLWPGGSLQQALRQAVDGDTLEIRAGEYRGEVAVIEHKRLTLRGVGGRPVFNAAGQSAEGKAILVVRNGDIRIENIEFRGARVPDHNGAGIRFERGRLQVSNCAFIDNENGILAGNVADAELTVQDSEFAQAPPGTRLAHLLYVGKIGRFTLSGSYFHGGRDGHLVKSRARENHVLYNRLVDDPQGTASYELEFPNGGLAWVVGNVIGQSADSRNPTIVSFGAEGTDERPLGLFMAHNTIINDALRPAWFVRVHGLPRPVAQRWVNNLFIGLGVADIAWADLAAGNFIAPASSLQDVAAGAYALAADSQLRGRAVDAGIAQGLPLTPVAEFSPPVGTRPLAARSRWSPGAFQD